MSARDLAALYKYLFNGLHAACRRTTLSDATGWWHYGAVRCMH